MRRGAGGRRGSGQWGRTREEKGGGAKEEAEGRTGDARGLGEEETPPRRPPPPTPHAAGRKDRRPGRGHGGREEEEKGREREVASEES